MSGQLFTIVIVYNDKHSMARNGGRQAVRRAGSCFLDNAVHYTDQWFSLANTKWLFIFTSIAQ